MIGEFEDADKYIKKAIAMQPDAPRSIIFEAAVLQFTGKPVEAYDAFARIGNLLPKDKLNYAIRTRDPKRIEQALEDWPMQARWPKDGPEVYAIGRLKALSVMGRKAEYKEELEALKERVSSNPPLTSWVTGSQYSPVIIPGLLGDREKVEALAKTYDEMPVEDAMAALTQISDISEAFMNVGDQNRALDYVDRLAKLLGPHVYLIYINEPAYDDLQDQPRFKKLKSEYKAWRKRKKTG